MAVVFSFLRVPPLAVGASGGGDSIERKLFSLAFVELFWTARVFHLFWGPMWLLFAKASDLTSEMCWENCALYIYICIDGNSRVFSKWLIQTQILYLCTQIFSIYCNIFWHWWKITELNSAKVTKTPRNILCILALNAASVKPDAAAQLFWIAATCSQKFAVNLSAVWIL